MGRNGLWRPRKHLYENFATIASKESQPGGISPNASSLYGRPLTPSTSRASNHIQQALDTYRHAYVASSRVQKQRHSRTNPVTGFNSAQGQHQRLSTRPTQHVRPAPAAMAGANSSMMTQPNSTPQVVIMDAQRRLHFPSAKFGELGQLSTLSDAFARQLGQEIMSIPPGPVLRAQTTTPAFPGKMFEPERFINVPVLLVAGYSQPLLNRAFVVLDPAADTDGHDIYIGRALVDQLESVSEAPVAFSATSRPAVSNVTMADPCLDRHEAGLAEEHIVPRPGLGIGVPPKAIRGLSCQRDPQQRGRTQLGPEFAHDEMTEDEEIEVGSYQQQHHSSRFSASRAGSGWAHVSQTSVPVAGPSSCVFSHAGGSDLSGFAELLPKHSETKRQRDSIDNTLEFGPEPGFVEPASRGVNARMKSGEATGRFFQGGSWGRGLNSEAPKERQPHMRSPGYTYIRNSPSMNDSFQFPIQKLEPCNEESRATAGNSVPKRPLEQTLRAHRPSEPGHGPSGSTLASRDTGELPEPAATLFEQPSPWW